MVWPPADVVGGVEPLELIAARSEDAVIWLESATAYPAGVELRMEVRWRAEVQNLVNARRRLAAGAPSRRGVARGAVPSRCRAGGRFEGNLARPGWWRGYSHGGAVVGRETQGALLRAGVGGGGSQRWSQDLWLWPLPPTGRLEFVCEWPALGIELTRTELDSDALQTAATRCKELFAAADR